MSSASAFTIAGIALAAFHAPTWSWIAALVLAGLLVAVELGG